MLRGEFILDGGLVIPNNITLKGAESLLRSTMRGEVHAALAVGLCQGVYYPGLQIQDLQEPTIGVNGYNRPTLLRNTDDWPIVGEVAGEIYVESKDIVWTPSGAGFDEQITRLFLCYHGTELTGNVFCLSGALPAPITVNAPFTSRYRIYLR